MVRPYLLFLLFEVFASTGPGTVDIEFRMENDLWQRGGIYEVNLILRNNSFSPIKIAGVQADFNYDPEVFPQGPTLVRDHITGYNFIVDSVKNKDSGLFYYAKAITAAGKPNYFILGGGANLNLATFSFRVADQAPASDGVLQFQVTSTVLQRLDRGHTRAILGKAKDGQIKILEAPDQDPADR